MEQPGTAFHEAACQHYPVLTQAPPLPDTALLFVFHTLGQMVRASLTPACMITLTKDCRVHQ